jgi:thioesterase domain-containing protein
MHSSLPALFALSGGRAQTCIVPLNDEALSENLDSPSFYCVHSIGGAAGTDFLELASYMPNVRFYGIQAPLKKMRDLSFGSVESVASYYAAELARFQTDGPFFLGGWSVGAVIGLEIARQLVALQREVRLLVAIDGAPEATPRIAGGDVFPPLRTSIIHLPRWLYHELRTGRRPMRRIVTFVARGTRQATKYAIGWRRGGCGPGLERSVSDFMDCTRFPPYQLSFMERLYRSAVVYRPPTYRGEVVVYEATIGPLFRRLSVGRAWKYIAPATSVIRIEGSHLDVVRPVRAPAVAGDLQHRILSAFRSVNAQHASNETDGRARSSLLRNSK